ncbi:MAG: hypothetical protein KDD56_05105 [Bdellovibrionales bacterium]|nr:hypothetical protein [Bdellovibrionales bacterium]
MGSSSSLPGMDVAYLLGKGYDPICELMRAIILRSIEDYNSKAEFKQEAIDYFEDEDEEYIFSFVSICRHLGFDPGKTKAAIYGAKHKISTRRRAA